MVTKLFEPRERAFAETIARLAYVNPFVHEDVRSLEQQASEIELPGDCTGIPLRPLVERPNLPPLLQKAEAIVETAQKRAQNVATPTDRDLRLYEDMALFVLYFRYRDRLSTMLNDTLVPLERPNEASGGEAEVGVGAESAKNFDKEYASFEKELRRYMTPIWKLGFQEMSAAHLFACFFQIRRAFRFIHANIFGQSRPIQRLRADVWHSVFTHDMRRYREVLYDRMHGITTLITGPSGTGKDLVAEAIGLSRYVAFRPSTRRFEEDVTGAFHPVNLSALSPELIESELFGHCKGAYTGALRARAGWFEICRPSHSVFLDEIGELDAAIQVKLLRVLQNRTFQRLGETKLLTFEGKVLAATNRDLNVEVMEGRFRRDFYYRLCSDQISTPSLKAQLDSDGNELRRLVEFIASRYYGTAAESLTEEVMAWIEKQLGAHYPWPGNVRELEQCIRNVLVRGEYRPLLSEPRDRLAQFAQKVGCLEFTADELMRYYCTLAYARTGSYVAAAEVLGLNRRTVRERIDQKLLSSLIRSEEP